MNAWIIPCKACGGRTMLGTDVRVCENCGTVEILRALPDKLPWETP